MRMNGVLTSVVTHLFIVNFIFGWIGGKLYCSVLDVSTLVMLVKPSFYWQSAGQHIKIQCCRPGREEVLAQYFCKAQQQLGKSHQLHLVLQGSVSDKSIHSLKIVLPLSWDTL